LLPVFKILFDLSYTDIGIITGGGLLITLISQLIIGRVSDKKNKRLLLSFGIILICLTFLLFPLVNGFLTLLLIFFLHRFSASFFHPIGIAWVSKIFKKDKLDWAMGIQSALGDFGAFIAILTIPFIAEVKNWTYPFYIWAVIGVICLFSVILFTIDLKEEKNIDNNDKEINFRHSLFEDWNSIKKTKLFIPAFIVSGLTWSVIINYLPLLLSERTSLSISSIGVVVSIWIGIGAIECFYYGKINSKIGRKNIVVLSYLTIGFMCMFLTIFTNLLVLLIIIIFLGLATFLTFPALFSFISEISDENLEGKTFGYIFTIELAGGTIVLLISGITSDIWGIWTPFMILGVLSFLSVIPCIKIISKKHFDT
jgi:MFS family permease